MVAITYRTLGPWGAGKGANLQPGEVDANFYSLAQALVDLQLNPIEPNGIESITVSGTQMTIYLTNGDVMGPFTLPVLRFSWRDEWDPFASYAVLDVFKVTDLGIFMVQVAHTGTGGPFDPDLATPEGYPYFLQLFGSADMSLGALGDVEVTDLTNNDFLQWVEAPDPANNKWRNVALGDMVYQYADNVDITGGRIIGLLPPVMGSEAATKAYVDALPAGMTSPDATMMANISGFNDTPAVPTRLSDFLDHVLATTTRGTFLFRGGTGWIAFPPGVPGTFLQTLGPGVDPVWEIGASGVTMIVAGTGLTTGASAITASGTISFAAIADKNLIANISGTTAAPTPHTLSAFLDAVLTNARGALVTRTTGGWVSLAPGLVGQYLKSLGAGADLVWDSPAGAGTVTSINAGTGISTGGAPITGTGSVSLEAIGNLTILANISGGSAAPTPQSLSALLDAMLGASRGMLLYRGASAWAALSAGTAGQVLSTGGAAANPSWINPPSGAAIANQTILANISGSTAVATGQTVSAVLDAVFSSSRGAVLFRGASGWQALPPGTSGEVLTTGGAAANPSWASAAASGASVTIADTAPSSPAAGDLWWDSAGGQLYLWYVDPSGPPGQFVPASNMPGPTGPTGATGPAGSANMSGMTAGQIPIAASATTVTSSGNLSGDVTTSGSLATTLATVNANVGTFQGLTLDAKGRVTAASNQGYLTTASAASTYAPLGGPTFSGNITLTNGTVNFNGSTGTISSGAGPLLYGDTTNAIWKLGSTGGAWFLRDSASADRFTFVAGDGSAIKPGGGSWVAPSDTRLKRDVTEYKSGLQAVLELNPIEYEYNGRGGTVADGRRYVGLVADDAARAMPELVDTMKGKLDPNDKDETDIQRVDPSALLYALVNAVKELSAKVAALEATR